MNRVPRLAGLSLLLVVTAACGDSGRDWTEASLYWQQPDTLFVPVSGPSDHEAISRDGMWVADMKARAVFLFAPGRDEYVALGADDREPAQIRTPVKLAVSRDLGVSVWDGETGSVDLFTLSGEYLRGFPIEFGPAEMVVSSNPIGYTFALASDDFGDERRMVIIRTDAQGGQRDTLLSPEVGPEVLRTISARPGAATVASSGEGLWVWARAAPDTIYEIAPRSARKIVVRPEDRGATGLLSDPERGMVWLAQIESGVSTLHAYDALPGIAEPFLGTRIARGDFSPRLVYDGILMGWSRGQRTFVADAYDLHVDQLERSAPAE